MYYDPMLVARERSRAPVGEAVRNHIENLPFNA